MKLQRFAAQAVMLILFVAGGKRYPRRLEDCAGSLHQAEGGRHATR